MVHSKQTVRYQVHIFEGGQVFIFIFFLPVVDSLSFCALDASLLLFGQTFTSSNYDNIECQGILPQIFIKNK